ncbi:MAG: inositol monophosphatase family protein [Candidatus Nanopelagicales bacterium]
MTSDLEVAQQIAQAVAVKALQMQADAGPVDFDNREDIKALKDSGDAAAQVIIDEILDELRPDDARLSEERPDDLTRLDADRVWITDPIDGTSNFGRRGTEFAVHVALWERDKGFTAAAVGAPAEGRILLNDEPTGFVLPERGLDDPVRIVSSRSRPSNVTKAKEGKALFEEFLKDAGVTNAGVEIVPTSSAGIKTVRIIDGHGDVYINDSGFFEWDAAAPYALAVAHGLKVTHSDGSKIEFNQRDIKVDSFVVARPELHPHIIEFIQLHKPK